MSLLDVHAATLWRRVCIAGLGLCVGLAEKLNRLGSRIAMHDRRVAAWIERRLEEETPR